jgi:hypothetical protein
MSGRRVIFIGGADTLQLEPDGKEYLPGEPVTMSDLQRASLTRAGLRFGSVPEATESEAEPEAPPPLESAEASAAVMAAPKAKAAPVAAPDPAPKEGK